MRLTKTDKDAFVRAAMAAVPQIDYKEQAEKVLIADAVAQMPPELGALYETHRPYFNHKPHYCAFGDGNNGTFYIPAPGCRFFASEQAKIEYTRLSNLAREQRAKFLEVQWQLDAAIQPCTTLKRAKEVLPPELHKFLPAERDVKTANVPAVVVDVVGAMKAMGWKAGE